MPPPTEQVTQIAVSPRQSRVQGEQYDAIYMLTSSGEVWRLDLEPNTERKLRWTQLVEKPFLATQLPAPDITTGTR